MTFAKNHHPGEFGWFEIYTALLCIALLMTSAFLQAEDLAAADEAFDRGEYATALELYQELANLQEPAATYRLGLMREQGLGTDPNPVAAASWYQKARA